MRSSLRIDTDMLGKKQTCWGRHRPVRVDTDCPTGDALPLHPHGHQQVLPDRPGSLHTVTMVLAAHSEMGSTLFNETPFHPSYPINPDKT